MASIGWIDFSKTYRQRVGTILDLLKPEGMVDELGIGTIRDAIANQLFPGISTIQTRAKYFFIVPYILYDYLALDKSRKKRTPVTKYLDDEEHKVIWELAERYNYEDGFGVIGITKIRPNRIMRRPSEIYWGGLNTFNIINTGGLGVNAFLSRRNHNSLESLISNSAQGDDSSGDDKDVEFENEFRIMISPNPNWDNDLDLELAANEADILKSRIIDVAPDQLVAALLVNDKLKLLFQSTDNYMQFAKLAVNEVDLSKALRTDLIVSHDFSELMFGAHIVYNYLLQKHRFEKEYWITEWNKWYEKLQTEMINYNEFDPSILFRPPYSRTTKSFTQEFIQHYWHLISGNTKSINNYTDLVIKQEYESKKHKARLRLGKLDDVREDRWIGLQRLSYRYNNAKVILNDIYSGLDK